MILCLRTVGVPDGERVRFLKWIVDNREVREQHGILLELVLEPPAGEGETVVITVWTSHEVFDAWIKTPERGGLTGSEVHQTVDYHPITRYKVVGGYINHELLRREPQL